MVFSWSPSASAGGLVGWASGGDRPKGEESKYVSDGTGRIVSTGLGGISMARQIVTLVKR